MAVSKIFVVSLKKKVFNTDNFFDRIYDYIYKERYFVEILKYSFINIIKTQKHEKDFFN